MKYATIHLIFSKNKDFVKDILAAQLGEIDYESFIETPHGLDAFIPLKHYNKEALESLISDFEYDDNITYNFEETEEKNWNEEWEKNFFQPIVIDQCVIHSSFHRNIPSCQYDIVIDPKMSFGTGHHETTSLMVSEILTMDLDEKTVLDMGCGTSVLAILASKKKAKSIIAIDIDEWCIENSKENIALNNTANIQLFLGGAELLKGRKFDVIIANINRNILLRDIPAYAECLDKNGELYLSGFYSEDIPVLEEKLNENGLFIANSVLKNNWALIKAVKSH